MMRSFLLLTIFAIFAIGIVMIFSTSSAEVLDHDLDKSTHQALLRQIAYALTGAGLAYALYRIGYQKFVSYSPWILGIFSFLLLLVLIPGVGRVVNGSRRWLSLGGFSLQPSEFVKYLVPAFFVYYMAKLPPVPSFREYLKMVGLLAVPMLLIMVEPNNGTAAVVGLSVAVLSFLARIPIKYWALPIVIFIAVGGIFAYNSPYVSARLKVYWNPELDLKGKGHQPYQAKIAAGSGEFFGRGPGNSMQKLSYLPEAQNDYIAAIYGEEFGFLGILLLVGLYAAVACLGFSIAFHAEDVAGSRLAAGITFLICFQAGMNLGVVSGLMPSTGLNLPFFSQGGSSLMANLAAVGVLLSICKAEKMTPTNDL